jgi:hypothetical protein
MYYSYYVSFHLLIFFLYKMDVNLDFHEEKIGYTSAPT